MGINQEAAQSYLEQSLQEKHGSWYVTKKGNELWAESEIPVNYVDGDDLYLGQINNLPEVKQSIDFYFA